MPLISLIEKYLGKVKVGTQGVVQDAWLSQTEKDLGFPLPESYKQFLLAYEFLSFAAEATIKCIAPPEFRDEADADILYSYRINLKNGLLNKNQLAVLELDDELYYFLVDADDRDHGYPVYLRDYAQQEDSWFADNFTTFLEKKLREL